MCRVIHGSGEILNKREEKRGRGLEARNRGSLPFVTGSSGIPSNEGVLCNSSQVVMAQTPPPLLFFWQFSLHFFFSFLLSFLVLLSPFFFFSQLIVMCFSMDEEERIVKLEKHVVTSHQYKIHRGVNYHTHNKVATKFHDSRKIRVEGTRERGLSCYLLEFRGWW